MERTSEFIYPPHVCIGDIKKSLPAAALAAVRTAAFAACLVLGLASCKMDMDDSAGGGRLAQAEVEGSALPETW